MSEWVLIVPEWLVLAASVVFGCVFSVALVFLLGDRLFPDAEIDPSARVSGDRRRREEIGQYLRAIGEPFAEDHPVGEENVAFYLPTRDVAITFDARAYYRIGRTDTHAVLVEHEMPGFHLGYRLPFETPEIDAGEDDAGESDRGDSGEATENPIQNAFATLGVSTTASTEEIRAAYRERIKNAHPDHGGDRESFRRIREAYTTVTDETG